MEIEKKLVVSAPRDKVWAMLMDPHVMTGAVPGMQSIDVISPTEYTALMKVKISFISARFKLHTHIVEQREPEYLRAEGTGEDTSVASSLKQTSEIFLTDTPEGGTELRIKVNVDLLGRLGTFGLSVMKTKADRMWDSFGKNLAAQLEGQKPGQPDAAGAGSDTPRESAPPAEPKTGPSNEQPPSHSKETPAREYEPAEHDTADEPKPQGWFSRLLGGNRTSVNRLPAQSASVIRIEIRQIDRTIAVEWPVEAANQCQEWLRDLLTRTK
ncbi:MAG: 4-hydroxybenzoyl-CoA reductase [Pusillimonas sp.]|jgi:carbon monoxide dehydrogenase subunit G|nr:4-hydroxybenzoyl-CoA reductase [Pusillimonas sp.]MBC43985.1 4-hydroxybenzoyl-CoA reductase [Pusillimonas sp.]|tara:strand:- start:85272 stop:86078 length:807 start_codon:yes stop_codon:yes gene_type:complete